LVLFAVNELDPFGNPQFDGILESLPSDSDLVLRVGIVIAHCGEDIIAFKSISNEFGCVPHDIDIGYHVQTVKIVRYGVTAPENSSWLHVVRDVVKQVLNGSLRWVA